uniref:Melanoregulin n=1 Tax=Saimiri boliviensis boliviensis TaxID=39432 RepID=A0A2K6U742_SAIBB
MGLRDWLRNLCCCRCKCLEERAMPEKEPLVSDSNPYPSFGATLVRDDEKNLWSMPHDVSHTEADDDRTLYNLIVIRNQQAKDSEEWQKLNYDIYTLRQIRREVRNRWKRILEDLGKSERDCEMVKINSCYHYSSISPPYSFFVCCLFLQDRLIALDAAEEFFKLARRTYPKKPGVPCMADARKELHYLPFPSP